MADGMSGLVTKEMVYDLAKSVEATLDRLRDDLRDIKEIIGRIERHFRQIGG